MPAPIYNEPPTMTPPTPTLASDWNTYVRDNFIALASATFSGMGVLLETLSPSGVANITTAATLTSYTHLGFFAYDIVCSADGKIFYLQMNGDSGSNYEYAGIGRSSSGTTFTFDVTSGTYFGMGTILTDVAQHSTTARGFIASRGNTTLNKVISGQGWGNVRTSSFAGHWKPATPAAITSLTFGVVGAFTITGTICVYWMNN